MYLRLVWNGTIGAAEEFSVGASFTIDNDFENWDQDSGDAIVALIAALAIPADIRTANPASVVVTGVRLEGRQNDGTILGASESQLTTPGAGTGTGTSHPPQTAIVLSMRSNTPGQSGRGRLYWPALSVDLDSNFQVFDPSPADLATAWQGYLTAIAGIIRDNAGLFPWTTVSLAVASITKLSQARVTRLEVGNVLDTQRRRRSGLVEAYSVVPFPAP